VVPPRHQKWQSGGRGGEALVTRFLTAEELADADRRVAEWERLAGWGVTAGSPAVAPVAPAPTKP
jgi:hypothetical protein